jgi:integrase
LNGYDTSHVEIGDMKPELVEIKPRVREMRCNGARVRITETRNGDYRFFRLFWKVGNYAPKRPAYADESAALKRAEEVALDLARAEGAKTFLSGDECVLVRELVRKVGSFKALVTATDFYLQFHESSASSSVLFSDVADKYVKNREARGRSKRYLETVKFTINVLKKQFEGRCILSIRGDEIRQKFGDSGYSMVTQHNLLAAFRALERFAQEERLIPTGIDLPSRTVVLPDVVDEEPEIFTPDELERLFMVLRPNEICYVATMAFAGARRAEYERLTEDRFDLSENLIRIDASVAKKGLRRTLEVTPNLAQWLALPGRRTISRRHVQILSSDTARLSKVGLQWKDNALRHSFCSYHLALHRNEALTADLAGNSPQMLRQHYRNLVGRKAAEAWFSITPESVRERTLAEGRSELLQW